MKLAIVSAMDIEIAYLLEKFTEYRVEEKNNFKFYLVKYHNLEMVISKSGVGKTAAGMLLATLNAFYKVDYVINTGICGGRKGHSNIGDTIVMDKCVYGDFSVGEITSNKFGQVSGCPQYFTSDKYLLGLADDAIIGDFVTTDRFMTSYEFTEGLINDYFNDLNVCGFDMESAAFAHAAFYFNLPFIAIRTTSDVVGHTSQEEYTEQEVDLCKLSCEYLYKYIKKFIK